MTVAASAYPLARLALRDNPRRRLLVVSTVLAKHVPTDAREARLAGAALALAVAQDERAADARAALFAHDLPAAERVLAAVDARPAHVPQGPVAVIGFAETATALGHATADALDAELTLHTTRRRVPGREPFAFEESHSHAPDQLLYAPPVLAGAGTVVIVDDELTTGRTARALVAGLRDLAPNAWFVVAALIDHLSPDDRHALDADGIAVVTLDSSPEALTVEPDDERATGVPVAPGTADVPAVVHHAVAGDPAPGRVGAGAAGRRALHATADALAATLREHDLDGVLGTGEFMYLPLLTAGALGVPCWSTTRSPVRLCPDATYPIRSGVAFAALDGADRTEYLYNVAGRRRLAVLVETAAERDGAGPLLASLAAAGVEHVTLVVCG